VNVSFARWRTNFVTGLAVVLPTVVSIALLVWLFGTISNITDTLLIFLPRSWTHERAGEGPMYWYCKLAALLIGILLVSVAGDLARHYFGRKLIQLVDQLMSMVPLLNKIYGTVKQVNEAFSSSKKSAFKQVVLIEYPRPGIYSLAFVTSDEHREVESRMGTKMIGVFVPTTPNPTSGFLLLVPESQVRFLDMSVAEGIKYVISLGAIAPGYPADAVGVPIEPRAQPPTAPANP
jgi:uncharacterized membrane protein